MRRRLGGWKVLVLVGVVLSGLVAGLSSGSAHSRITARPAKSKPVVRVFGLGVETAPALGALFPPATFEVTEGQLAAREVNASTSSQVDVSYTFCDTKGSPAGAVACAKQAASPTACGGKPCDVALDTADSNDNLDVPLLAKEGIPIVGATTSTPEAADTRDDFGITAGLAAVDSGLSYVMKKLGAHKVGIMNVDRPDVQSLDSAIVASAKLQGLTVAGQTVLTSSTVAPNASINSVMGGGANGLIDAAVGNVGAAIKYAKQTYPGVKIAIPVNAVAKAFFNGLPFSVTNGVGVTSYLQPTTATGVPGIKDFISGGGLKAATAPYRGLDYTTATWLGVRFVANVADNISGKVTKASMLHALRTAQNINMYGIVPPWNAAQRGKNGAAPNTPYNIIVAEKLHNEAQSADNPGVFVSARTGKVAYVDPGFKTPKS